MITIKNNKLINYGNRGMTLENDINLTNDYYKEKKIALIYKMAEQERFELSHQLPGLHP